MPRRFEYIRRYKKAIVSGRFQLFACPTGQARLPGSNTQIDHSALAKFLVTEEVMTTERTSMARSSIAYRLKIVCLVLSLIFAAALLVPRGQRATNLNGGALMLGASAPVRSADRGKG